MGNGEHRALFWGGIIAALIIAAATVAATLLDDSDDITLSTAGTTEKSATSPSQPESKPESGRADPEPSVTQAPEPPQRIRVSISELAESGKAQYLGAFKGDYGTQSIGGSIYPDGVSMLAYSDGSGVPELAIQTEGRFTKVSGIVGIDGNAECINSPASVAIADDRGQTLWGPETVGSRSRVPFSVDIEGAIRIYLTQDSLTDFEGCNNGEVNPAWGEVHFVGFDEL